MIACCVIYILWGGIGSVEVFGTDVTKIPDGTVPTQHGLYVTYQFQLHTKITYIKAPLFYPLPKQGELQYTQGE